MYAEERQQAIAELVVARGRLSVLDLAEAYGVTTETVRRDLSVLERAGLLRRVHGGAVPVTVLTALERALDDRDKSFPQEKDRIAAAAAEHLPPSGGSVVIDAGSTTTRLAPHVVGRDLTVMTHAITVAARLAGVDRVELHLLPGRVRLATQAAVGEVTVAALSQVRADVAFLGTNGISLGHGLSTPDHSEAACKRAIVAAGIGPQERARVQQRRYERLEAAAAELAVANRLRCLQRGASLEDRQPAEQLLLGLLERLPGPLERGTQRSLARGQVPRTAGQ